MKILSQIPSVPFQAAFHQAMPAYLPSRLIERISDRYEGRVGDNRIWERHVKDRQHLFDRFEGTSGPKNNWAFRPKDNRVWVTIDAKDADVRSQVADLGVSIESVSENEVKGTASRSVLKKLRWAGLAYSIQSFEELSEKHKLFPDRDDAYHDYYEMQTELRELARLRPDLVKLTSIGKTVLGLDIWALQINQGFDENKPGALFIGTHHAREHLSTEVSLKLARYLVENADKPEMVELLKERDITIIPMLNPDGAQFDINDPISQELYYRWWRKNRATNDDGSYGVDLNRNYSYGWGGGGASTDPGDETYRGPRPFSEPETKAIKDFIESKPNIKILLSYHTYSELILYPWGHKNDPISDKKELKIYETMARQMAKWTGYEPMQSSGLYIASGDTTDWAWGEHQIYSFTFELTPKSQSAGGFYPGPKVIGPTFEKNIKSALYLIGLADDPSRVLQSKTSDD